MTCDVEEHSIEKNTLDDSVISRVHSQGIPRLLNLFSTHEIKATFFFTGYFSERSPETLLMVKKEGHEIGCHSYSHDPKLALDNLSLAEQIKEIGKAKYIIEKTVGPIESFRAPALRINKYTIDALLYHRFKFDSSLCPRRFDGPLSSGFIEKLKWMKAKEGVHYLTPRYKFNSNRKIIEVPISANILPYIGTFSRISPNLMDILRKSVFHRSKKYNYPLVFDTHPNECIDIIGKPIPTRRSKNIFRYIFSDLIRHRLKIRNLGSNAISLLDKEIRLAKSNGFTFKMINEMKV